MDMTMEDPTKKEPEKGSDHVHHVREEDEKKAQQSAQVMYAHIQTNCPRTVVYCEPQFMGRMYDLIQLATNFSEGNLNNTTKKLIFRYEWMDPFATNVDKVSDLIVLTPYVNCRPHLRQLERRYKVKLPTEMLKDFQTRFISFATRDKRFIDMTYSMYHAYMRWVNMRTYDCNFCARTIGPAGTSHVTTEESSPCATCGTKYCSAKCRFLDSTLHNVFCTIFKVLQLRIDRVARELARETPAVAAPAAVTVAALPSPDRILPDVPSLTLFAQGKIPENVRVHSRPHTDRNMATHEALLPDKPLFRRKDTRKTR